MPSTDVTRSRLDGWLDGVARLVMRSANVAAVKEVTRSFRLIELEGESLKGIAWSPGDKLEVKTTRGLAKRTYTPLHWDKATGSTQILAYCHGGGGPGDEWVRNARSRDECLVLGPRAAIKFDAAPIVLVGDETSIGLAIALSSAGSNLRRVILDVDDSKEARVVLSEFGIKAFDLVERRPADAHLPSLVSLVTGHLASPSNIALTGNAKTIQHIHRALKARGLERSRLKTKPHWAPGKTGLD